MTTIPCRSLGASISSRPSDHRGQGPRRPGASALLLAVLAAMLLGAPVPLAAALAFDHPEQTARPGIADPLVKFTYSFTNLGTAPVTIIGVKPSCSCTAAKLVKTTYRPGESGSLAVTFTVGSRTGINTKTVSISTDDPLQPTSVLTLHVDIPPQANFSQRAPSWLLGSPPDPQVITVSIPEGLDMTVTKVVPDLSRGPGCAATLSACSTSAAGRTYTITLVPISTAAVGTTTVNVETNLKTYHIYVRVRAPRPTPPVAAVPPGTEPPALDAAKVTPPASKQAQP